MDNDAQKKDAAKASPVTLPVLILAIAALIFCWYWYSYRPYKVMPRCLAEAEFNPVALAASDDRVRQEFIERDYSICLHRFGIK